MSILYPQFTYLHVAFQGVLHRRVLIVLDVVGHKRTKQRLATSLFVLFDVFIDRDAQFDEVLARFVFLWNFSNIKILKTRSEF